MGQSPVFVEASEAPIDRTVMERAEARSIIVKIAGIVFCLILFYPLGVLAEADSGRGKNLVM
jgi:hypothetical protein